MKVLFFIEPLIEMGRPSWKFPWIEFSHHLLWTLAPDRTLWPDRFRVLTNEPLAAFGKDRWQIPGEVFASIPQKALRDAIGGDYLAATRAWYEGGYPDSAAAALAERVKSTLGEFRPDVVITFSPAPYLRLAFPDALVLHHEYGLFSRPPFPPTFYLDPCGMFRHSFLRTFRDTLWSLPAAPGQDEALAGLRKRYLDEILVPCSPFREEKARLRGEFRAVWLLPLQFSGYYAFDSHAKWVHQFDYLHGVLDALPGNIALLVSEHPEYPILDEATIEYFSRRFPNFVFSRREREVLFASQFLLDLVDGVITVSSSVGLQTLLWKKKLVALGDTHLTAIADGTNLDDVAALGDQPWNPQKETILYWLLTRYYIPAFCLHDDAFLGGFLARSVAKFRTAGIAADFFEPIDSEPSLVDRLIASASDQQPILRPEPLGALPRSDLLDAVRRLRESALDSARELESAGSMVRDLSAQAAAKEEAICGLELRLTGTETRVRELIAESAAALERGRRLQNELDGIHGSVAWKAAAPVRRIEKWIRP